MLKHVVLKTNAGPAEIYDTVIKFSIKIVWLQKIPKGQNQIKEKVSTNLNVVIFIIKICI